MFDVSKEGSGRGDGKKVSRHYLLGQESCKLYNRLV